MILPPNLKGQQVDFLVRALFVDEAESARGSRYARTPVATKVDFQSGPRQCYLGSREASAQGLAAGSVVDKKELVAACSEAPPTGVVLKASQPAEALLGVPQLQPWFS